MAPVEVHLNSAKQVSLGEGRRQSVAADLSLARLRLAALSASILLGSTAWASPSVLKLSNFDTAFSNLCAGGTVTNSGNKCEYAAVELKRGQNNGTGGNAEIYARTGVFGDTLTGDLTVNGSTQTGALQSNALPWGSSSTGTYSMSWRLDGNPDADSAFKLNLTVDGQPSTTLSLDVADSSFVTKGKPNTDGSQQLWIRLRTQDGNTPGEVSLSSILSHGVGYQLDANIWKIASSATDANPYFLIQGLDFTQPWYVEGSALLSMAGTTSRERPAINWKFTQSMGNYSGESLLSVSSVPEPSVWLLQAGGLGLLAWAGRRASRRPVRR